MSPVTKLIVPLTQEDVPSMREAMAAAAAAGADLVELRLDYLDHPDAGQVGQLLADRPCRVIVTCRPHRQGGQFVGDEAFRLSLLAHAAGHGADYIDIEDDVPPSSWPAGKIIVSHHDFAARPVDARQILDRLARTPAAVLKLAFMSAGPEDALAALDLLRQSPKPAIVLAMGEHGVASRILARKFGAFGTFAALTSGAESAPGQFTVGQMRQLYRWDAIGPATLAYGVVGSPIAHSMSPAIHNASFAALGIDAVYLPLRVEAGPAGFTRFFRALRQSPWADFRGLSVTIPHKENALAAVAQLAQAGQIDDLSRRIGAINTLRFDADGTVKSWNTDYAGAIDALCGAMGIQRADLAGRCVAVVGAGGAARAIVAALANYGADIHIYNRTMDRGTSLAREFGATAFPLDELGRADCEILINCTSVGMYPRTHDSPVPPDVLTRSKVVFDTVYNPAQTLLLRQAQAAGCLCISGLEMFINQAAAQFEAWTNQPTPRDIMRQVVLEQLGQ